MSYEVNGLRLSYDYEDLILELKEDLEDGIVKPESVIYVVRGSLTELSRIGYKPIIDYYLKNDYETFTSPLETLYNKEEYSDKEWEEMLKKQQEMIKQYEDDEKIFEEATVTAVLTEMEQWNSI
jgi:hypothetical protein